MKNKYNYKHSFFFGFIFHLLDLKLPENAEPVVNYSFGVLSLSILLLFSIGSAFTNLISIYLILKYDINTKFKDYPKVLKLIKYYEGASLANILFELCFGLFCLFTITISSAIFFGVFVSS